MGSISVMDWNSKTASECEWENLAGFRARTNISSWVQPSKNESEGNGGIDNVSMYSSGGGGFSGSDLGHVTSSKSSISASGDSSLKEGMKTHGTCDSYLEDSSGKKELTRVDSIGKFPSSGASTVSGESIIGLKLGKRTYFEDACAATTTKSSTFSIVSSSSVVSTKRSRVSYQSSQTPRCQVEGCNHDLKSAKDYHRRHRICENHSKSPKVIVAGMERRFCQQCSRFHELSEFDDKKRSCRRRLSDHNARRRRPQPETIQFNYGRLSSSIYDGRQRMNVVLNGVPFYAANPAWQNASGLSVTHIRDSPTRPLKAGSSHRQRNMPSIEMPDATSMLGIDSDKMLSFESSTPWVFSQGSEASAFTSNTDVAPDFRRALSLLSTTSWGLYEPEPTSLDQLMHVNHSSVAQPSSMAQPARQAGLPNWPLAPVQLEQVEQPPAEPQVHSLNFHSNRSTNFQEFQLFKAPNESGCFLYSSQIN